MKDNLNIEKLFKDKFENFEGNVNPEMWANISKGVSSNAAAGSSIGLGIKALIISASAVVVGLTVYFVGGFNQSTNQIVENKTISEQIESIENAEVINESIIENVSDEIVIIAEENDPVITENEIEIINELSNPEILDHTNELKENVDGDDITSISNSDGDENSSSIDADKNNEGNTSSDTQEKVDNSSDDVVSNTVETTKIDEDLEILIPTGKIESVSGESIFEFDFKANANNHEKLTWNFGDGNVSFKENPTHVYTNVGSYQVELTVTSANNTSYTETKLVEIMTTASIDNIANVITPNGDRINDEFFVNALDIDEFSITITNQLGQTVYKSIDQNFIWDGTDFSGNNVEKAVYNYYIIAKGNDGAILKIPGQLYVR